MTYSVARNTCINLDFNISLFDQNIDDEDCVYLHNQSIKIVPYEEASHGIQTSLTELLSKKLNNAGRASLAERTIKKQSITYKEFNSLVHQINKPRTLQTLLDNRYLQWSINLDSFPDFVKDDMKKNGISVLPSNIYDLYKTITCSESGSYSLVLLKHIVTQCMEIDYNSDCEEIQTEYNDCMQLLSTNLSSNEEIKKALQCTNY